jgi:hypothetical protein
LNQLRTFRYPSRAVAGEKTLTPASPAAGQYYDQQQRLRWHLSVLPGKAVAAVAIICGPLLL